ncbi:MAG: replicative DNA helicase [Holosporaceae bacterium]|jgi:replicative DNA helicase|nr:replicative DNA helicase [Holosporaceae bacterium]
MKYEVKVNDNDNNNNNVAARVLPYNMEAEQSLLGAIMLNNECFEVVSELLLPAHFSVPVNGKIYAAIGHLISQDQVADPITLRAYFEKNEELQSIGGGNYLVQLVNAVVSISGVEDYANLVRDLYLRRQLIILGEDISHRAHTFNINENAIDQIETAEAKLYEISMTDQRNGVVGFAGAISSTMEVLESAFLSDSKISGITSGFVDLDKWLGGLSRSDLIILAARPSMGKTALATNIAFNAAMAFAKKIDGGGKVLFYSLEMSKEQLVTRILSQECNIASERIRRGEIKEDDFAKLVATSKRMAELSLFIDDSPLLNVAALRSRSRKLQRQQGLDLIVVDYLQLLQGNSDRKNENRVQEISEITRMLKSVAKELNIPVLALSQLSRAVETRDDKRPQLSDLRESGSIEQDADVVMFIYREEYYESRKKPDDGTDEYRKWMSKMTSIHNLAEIIVAKQRHGPVGTVKLFFDGKHTKFDNLSDSRR